MNEEAAGEVTEEEVAAWNIGCTPKWTMVDYVDEFKFIDSGTLGFHKGWIARGNHDAAKETT